MKSTWLRCGPLAKSTAIELSTQAGALHSSVLLAFLTGTWPNITRNAIVNCAEMVTYDIIKEKLLDSHLFTGESG